MTWWAGYGWGVVSAIAAVGVVLRRRYVVVRRPNRSDLDELVYGPIVRDALHAEADSYTFNDKRDAPW